MAEEETLEEVIKAMAGKEHLQRFKRSLVDELPPGMTPAEAGAMVHEPYLYCNRKERYQGIITATAKSARKHLEEHGGLAIKEVSHVAAHVYGCQEWEFMENIINRVSPSLRVFKHILHEPDEKRRAYTHDLLGRFLDEGIVLHHKKQMSKRQSFFFEDSDEGKARARRYAAANLVKSYKKREGEKTPGNAHRKMSASAAAAPHENGNRQENPFLERENKQDKEPRGTQKERSRTVEEYIERYRLDTKQDSGTIEVQREAIERELKEAGLRIHDDLKAWRHVLAKNIIRNYEFRSILFFPGTEAISRSRLDRLATIYSSSEQAREDTKNLFGLKE